MDNYEKVYHLERYLFEDVAERFRRTHNISAFDFFCIVIWKANRAKSRISAKLLRKGYENLESAVAALANEIVSAKGPKDKLKVLIEDWKFALPMASAILTVLDDMNFTVYDVRVCDQLEGFHGLQNRRPYERQWTEYLQFVSAVRQNAPTHFNLRGADQWLWGKSFCEQLEHDLLAKFE